MCIPGCWWCSVVGGGEGTIVDMASTEQRLTSGGGGCWTRHSLERWREEEPEGGGEREKES